MEDISDNDDSDFETESEEDEFEKYTALLVSVNSWRSKMEEFRKEKATAIMKSPGAARTPSAPPRPTGSDLKISLAELSSVYSQV